MTVGITPDPGLVGPTGPTGATGAASTVTGPTGPTGPTGSAAASGLVYITGGTFSVSGTLNVNNCFSATYRNYKIVYSVESNENDIFSMRMRLRVSGADNTTSNYYLGMNTVNEGGTETNTGNNAATFWTIGYSNSNNRAFAMRGDLTIYNPFNDQPYTGITGTITSANTSNAGYGGGFIAGNFGDQTSFTGFSFLTSTGSFGTGIYRVYGLADS